MKPGNCFSVWQLVWRKAKPELRTVSTEYVTMKWSVQLRMSSFLICVYNSIYGHHNII